MNNIILTVQNLTKQFDAPSKTFWDKFKWKKEKFTAVNNISFNVKEGEILGFLGPNGAGKTTTINMVLGLSKPTSGTIHIFGLDFEKNREEILGQMNFSSAYNELPYQLSIWESLFVFGELYNVQNLRKRIETLLDVFELQEIRNNKFSELSAGQKARLNLAKGFINKPRLILLDEPTASLDPDIADKVRKYLLASQEKFKTTILFTSHNMAEVEEICDRVVFINHGKIIDEDTPEGLAKKISQVTVKLLIKDGQKRTLNFMEKNKWQTKVDGRFVSIRVEEDEVAWLLAGLADIGVSYSEISIDKPTLEDYFLKQTRGEKNEMA